MVMIRLKSLQIFWLCVRALHTLDQATTLANQMCMVVRAQLVAGLIGAQVVTADAAFVMQLFQRPVNAGLIVVLSILFESGQDLRDTE